MPLLSRRQLMALLLSEGLMPVSQALPLVPLFVGNLSDTDHTSRMLAWMGSKAGLSWDYRTMPWLRAQKLVAADEGLMYGLSRTPQREKDLTFSLPIWTNFTWVIVRADDQHGIRQIGDLDGQSVCWGRGSSYGEMFSAAGHGQMVVTESADDEGALRMVAAGRCRAALITLETGRVDVAKRHPTLAAVIASGLDLVPTAVKPSPLHFAAARGGRWAGVIERIDEVVKRRRSELDRLHLK